MLDGGDKENVQNCDREVLENLQFEDRKEDR
jgi:hypothetical protein